MKVTFVQAVWAKSGPTIDFPKSSARANPPVTVRPGCATCGFQPLAHESHQAALSAAELEFQPNDNPITTTAASATVFAKVNVFWLLLLSSSTRVYVNLDNKLNAFV